MDNKIFSLQGKIAVVTGGTGILGQKFCSALAAHGAQVVVVDLNQDRCAEVAGALTQEYGGDHLGIMCDVTHPAQVQKLVSTVESILGGIHILANNAATKGKSLEDFFAPFEKFKLETWRGIMSVNVDGMFLMAQAVGSSMISKKIKGSIIQTASIYGVVAPDQRIYEGSSYNNHPIGSPAVYSASKAAVIGLTRYLAAYWGEHGIRVNTLTPGGVESGQNNVFQDKYSARVPLGRMATAQDICGGLVFLASDASSYVTGHNLMVDGGLTAW